MTAAQNFLIRHTLFGINLVSWVGFVMMGFAYHLTRSKSAVIAFAIALMGAGTALVFLGLYLTPSAPAP